MLRRAAISVLILLTGGGGAMAGTLDPSIRNHSFQPGEAKSIPVLQPSRARWLAANVRHPGVTVKKITPIVPAASSRVEIGRTAFKQPGAAAVRPLATQAGSN
jgi:hypothetical protein